MAGNTKYPGKTEVREHSGLDTAGKQPTEMDAPLCLIDFVNDFFRAGKLFVARHLAHGFAKARGGKRRQGNRVEVFGPGLGAQRQANGRVRARLSNALPQGKELFGGYNDALLIEEPWRQTCILKHGGHTNSQLL